MSRLLWVLPLFLTPPALIGAESAREIRRPDVTIPRIQVPPTLEDFLEMEPTPRIAGQMAKVAGFIQRENNDGDPSSQLTEVYLGYDDEKLYLVFVAFDDQPEKVRARMAGREAISRDDDLVYVNIDTFNDERRAFVFVANAYGIQRDALYNEVLDDEDASFDTLWYSDGDRTDRGYVVWFAIPFKSLRFADSEEQTWGLLLERWIPHLTDWSFWPQATNRVQGYLNQTGRVQLKNISPGRNIQLIPYAASRSFRALDPELPDGPAFVQDLRDVNVGLDAKFVFRDSLVLDATVNPDFSQVESDEPQITANERFEVFFPERRPFFIENASFFETPINLVFTRRIADPQTGARLTGKTGPWAIGALVSDDQAPGKSVLPGSPLFGKRAYYGLFRLNRDVFEQGSVGAIYTGWEFDGNSNQVAGVDASFKLGPNWSWQGQAVASTSTLADGTDITGPAYEMELSRSGRSLSIHAGYTDVGDAFRSVPGFINRRDIRQVRSWNRYSFWPEGKTLLSWGPSLGLQGAWDHEGTLLDRGFDVGLEFNFERQTSLEVFYDRTEEVLRPKDFESLLENRAFPQSSPGFSFRSNYFSKIGFEADYSLGTTINFSPPEGQEPESADMTSSEIELTLRPSNPLRIDIVYLWTRLAEPTVGSSIFNNHIGRTRLNWQLNRELSLRFIAQYDSLLANEPATSLPTVKNLNFDALMTYLVNPWTALYIGYNGNAQNIDLVEAPDGRRRIRPTTAFRNDAWQVFAKFSYLFRF